MQVTTRNVIGGKQVKNFNFYLNDRGVQKLGVDSSAQESPSEICVAFLIYRNNHTNVTIFILQLSFSITFQHLFILCNTEAREKNRLLPQNRCQTQCYIGNVYSGKKFKNVMNIELLSKNVMNVELPTRCVNTETQNYN